MPVDSRRIQGPENSFCYTLLEREDSGKSGIENELVILDAQGNRRDKRKPTDARPLFLKTGVVTQAKGSAYIEQGNTKVICSIFGPREVQKKSDFSLNGQLFCEFKFAPFSCKKRRGHQPDNEELELSGLLRETLESAVCLYHFPKAQVEVNVIVLENGGSAFAAAITCASLALANASIPMFDLVIGASVRQLTNSILLDPLRDEEWEPNTKTTDHHNSNYTIGYMPSLEQVCCCLHEGVSDLQQLEQMLKLATEYCVKALPVVQTCLKESVQKSLQEESEKVVPSD